jgi:hypothetical protein
MAGGFFNSQSVNDYMRDVLGQIDAEIETMPKEHLDGDLPSYFAEKYAAKVPVLGNDITMEEPDCDLHASRATIRLRIPYEGNSLFFQMQPMSSPLIAATWTIEGTSLVIPLTAHKSQPAVFQRDKDTLIGQINDGLNNIRREIAAHFNQLPARVTSKVQWRKSQTAAHHQFVTDLASVIPIHRRNDGAENIIVPVVRKPVPILPATKDSDPLIEMAAYDDILSMINRMVSVFERSPKVFAEMEEEDLRTILLVGLNGLYEGGATGETFNSSGRTDILIRQNDRNVFIAECLIWDGEKKLLQKLDEQLFQYATWRDSKLAILVFNRKKGFTDIVRKMKAAIDGHAQRVRTLAYAHETGARYIFHRADDVQRHVTLTALAFDVPSSGG